MGKVTVYDLVKAAEIALEGAGVPDAKNDAAELFCHLMNIDKTRFFMEWAAEASEETCEAYARLVDRRRNHEPLQLITRQQAFLDLVILCRQGVLIPRQDSEAVALAAEELLDAMDGKEVLDLCCGSGVLGLSLAARAGARVTFSDISAMAVELTKDNLKHLGLRAEGVYQGDLFEPVKEKKFQLIVCNPPYIATCVIPTLMPEVRKHEPMSALNGGADGLDYYRRIVEEAPAYLTQKGALVLEIGHDQAGAVTAMMQADAGWYDITIMKDLAQNPRVVTACYDHKKSERLAKEKERIAKETAKAEARKEKWHGRHAGWEAWQAKWNARRAAKTEKKVQERDEEDK